MQQNKSYTIPDKVPQRTKRIGQEQSLRLSFIHFVALQIHYLKIIYIYLYIYISKCPCKNNYVAIRTSFLGVIIPLLSWFLILIMLHFLKTETQNFLSRERIHVYIYLFFLPVLQDSEVVVGGGDRRGRLLLRSSSSLSSFCSM